MLEFATLFAEIMKKYRSSKSKKGLPRKNWQNLFMKIFLQDILQK